MRCNTLHTVVNRSAACCYGNSLQQTNMPEEQPITITFPNGRLASKVVDLVVRSRPIGWSRKSRSPYYNKPYALWIKVTVDAMIEDGRAKVFLRESFPGINESTLYTRVHQALLYLVEQLDTEDKKYALFKEKIVIRRKQGVILEFKDINNIEGKAQDFVELKELPKWKIKLDEWLESGEFEPFIMTNLLLSEKEKEQLHLELDDLTNIMSSISTQELKLVRVS